MGAARSALPIERMTASSTWVVTLPSSIDGVPTAIIAISDFATASAVSVVAARRPAATCPATSSSRPFSRIGAWPALISATLSASMSTPMTE